MRSRGPLLTLVAILLTGACSAPTGDSPGSVAQRTVAPSKPVPVTESTAAAATHPATSGSATSGPATSGPAPTRAATKASSGGPVWTNQSLQPLSHVHSVAGVPVLLTHEGKDVHAVGLDPEDGAVRWRRPVGPSGVVAGIAVHFGVLQDRYLAYFEPLPSGTYARLVIVDPRGESTEVARSETTRFSSYPSPCHDDPQFICVEAQGSDGSATFRLRPGMDGLEQAGEAHGTAQSIGPAGLMRTTDARGGAQRVGVQRNGKTIWSKTERELFGPAFTTDGGWGFRSDADRHLIYGTVGPVVDVGDTLALKESSLLVGLDARTGAVRWKQQGLESFCDVDFTGTGKSDPFVVCEWTGGTATVGDRTKTTGASVALRRLDPATGRTVWRTDLGPIEMPGWARPHLDLIGPSEFGVETKRGPVVVSLADGSTRPRKSSDESWREETVRFEGRTPYNGAGPTSYERHGEVSRLVRDGGDGLTLSRPIPAPVGAQVGALRIVSTKDAVLAYRAPKP